MAQQITLSQFEAIDFALRITYRLTGSRAVSEMISERRVNARWNAAKAAHITKGGVCMSMQSDAGTQEILL